MKTEVRPWCLKHTGHHRTTKMILPDLTWSAGLPYRTKSKNENAWKCRRHKLELFRGCPLTQVRYMVQYQKLACLLLTWVNPEFNIVINLPVAPLIHGSCRHTSSQRVGQRGNLGLTVTGRVTRTTWRDEWGCWICMSATSRYIGGIDTLSGRKAWGGSCVTASPSKNKEMFIFNHMVFQWMRFGELTKGLGLASSETEWNKC